MSRWIARSHARQRFLIVGHMLPSRAPAATSGIALFLPRVGVVVIAANFPVAGRVVLDELDAGVPLRALPEVEIGNEPTHGRAVVERERLAVEAIRDERVVGRR